MMRLVEIHWKEDVMSESYGRRSEASRTSVEPIEDAGVTIMLADNKFFTSLTGRTNPSKI